jgi:hypothetical protein
MKVRYGSFTRKRFKGAIPQVASGFVECTLTIIKRWYKAKSKVRKKLRLPIFNTVIARMKGLFPGEYSVTKPATYEKDIIPSGISE